jgi:ferritin-like metal-binding protein YciE
MPSKSAQPKKSASKGSQSKSSSRSKSGKSGVASGALLQKFFVDSLKDIYWAEKHLLKALPKMQKKATSEELKTAMQEHTAQTEQQVLRLEQVFEMLQQKAVGKKCEAMDGLTREAESIMEETKEDTMTRDAALIMAAQKVEHYEIATYGGLVTLAKTIGNTEAAELLNQTLQEEKQTDQRLTQIAESTINIQAAEEVGEVEEES